MKIKIGDLTAYIRWEHNFMKKKLVEKNGKPKMIRHGKILKSNKFTKCIIYTGTKESMTVLGTGLAKCHSADTFCKCEGRKLSLSYALDNIFDNRKELHLTKEDRKNIWIEYTKVIRCSFKVSDKKPKKRDIGEREELVS